MDEPQVELLMDDGMCGISRGAVLPFVTAVTLVLSLASCSAIIEI
jgi:hypothetical protein